MLGGVATATHTLDARLKAGEFILVLSFYSNLPSCTFDIFGVFDHADRLTTALHLDLRCMQLTARPDN